MFTMSHHTYAYAAAPALPPPRQFSGHGTSSAFSSSANPDEDWTKISDLAERRRIQNRIAQRNYRKKLKRRLEDLERRAATSDETSSGGEKPTKAAKGSKRQQQQPQQPAAKSQKQTAATPPKPMPMPMPQSQFTPPMHSDDEYLFPSAPYDDREGSHTPPLFAYSTYPPPPEDLLLPSYGASQSYRSMVTETYPDYLAATVSVALPSMTHFSDAIKREPPSFPADASLSPYMDYANYMSGLDITAGAPSPYDHSNPHTPPLSHSFDHSADCSDSGSHGYPATPLSMPGSPGMVQQQM